jgi:uncharacterized protein (DUF58 family)
LKADLARLNHVLIPATKSERDRYRNGRFARRLRPITWLFARLTREGRVLFAAASLAMLFAGDIVRTESHVLVLGSASLLFASLLFTRAYRLRGVVAEVHAPARVTVGDHLAITISLRSGDDAAEHRSIRVEQPLLPWDGKWIGEPPRIAKLPTGGRASTIARARFSARGEHHIDPFRAAAILPLGLSQGAPLRTEGARFVVVPKVARVVSVGLPVNPREQPGGVARSSRTGAATDILGVRPYRPGDPVRDLHARSWARLGEPVVREYQEESFARIGIIVDSDVSRTSAEHFEGALSLAAGVIATLCRGEALVDLLVVGEYARRLASARGMALLDQAMDLLAVVEPSGSFSADRILMHIRPHLEHLSAIVLIVLGWDDSRAALAAAIRARGASCRVLIVGNREERAPHATTLALDAIVAGEALSL